MHKFILILTSLISVCSVNAQDKNMEAKAAYLLAEEEFEATRYASAINYLDQATEKLGAANAKILYLKILSLEAVSKTDKSRSQELAKAIEAFERTSDFASFNDDKKLEVYKLKMKMARITEQTSKQVLETAGYDQLKLKGLKLGMTLKELYESHPPFFAKVSKTPPGGNVEYYGIYKDVLVKIYVKEGRVFKIDGWLHSKGDESKNTEFVNEIKASLGGDPTDETVTKNDFYKNIGNITKTRTVTWVENNTILLLTQTDIDHYTPQHSKSHALILSIILKPTY